MAIHPMPYGGKGTAGSPGATGADGESAYQIWLSLGNTGTETQFIESLKGADGEEGPAGPVGPAGLTWRGEYSDDVTYLKDDAVGYEGASYFSLIETTGVAPLPENDAWALMAAYGERGPKGAQGDSAYDIWVEAGNEGSESVFLASLIGKNGTDGTNGTSGVGISSSSFTYQTGTSGTVAPTGTWTTTVPTVTKGSYLWTKLTLEFSDNTTTTGYCVAYSPLDGTNGTNGSNGKDGESAYALAVDNGYSGTETEWLASLKGADGKDATTSTKYFGISPVKGYFVRHPLGDSGLYYVMKGTGNYDVGDGIYDANSPRVISYRFVALWGGGGVDGYYNQAYTTTSSDYIFDSTSYFNAQENQICYVTDTATGRVWRIERWGMSRLSGRYIVEITEFSDGVDQTYTDYSTAT